MLFILKQLTAFLLAFKPSLSAKFLSDRTFVIDSARDEESPGSTRSPLLLCSIISGSPPTLLAITGFPMLIASRLPYQEIQINLVSHKHLILHNTLARRHSKPFLQKLLY